LHMTRHPDRAALVGKARDWIDKRGGLGVFLSRWLVSPLGPYVNFIGGTTGLGWRKFTVWGIGGELVWVGLYIGLGIVFSDNLSAAAEIVSDTSGLLVAGLVTVFLGWRVMKILRKSSHH